MTLRGRQTVAALVILGSLGTAVFVILSGDPEQDMVGAVRAGDLGRVQHLLSQDPALARARVLPPGSRTGRIRVQWEGQYVVGTAVSQAGDSTAILDALVASGADLGVRIHGRTLLHEAASLGNVRVAEWLLDRGADPNARDECDECPERGQTPLHRAHRMNDRELIELLHARGADPRARDAAGRTPLHIVAEMGSVEAARALCGRGADPQAQDGQERTPLEVARTVDRAGRASVHSEIYGGGELAEWLGREGPCAQLATLAQSSGGVVPEEQSVAILRKFACGRGLASACERQ